MDWMLGCCALWLNRLYGWREISRLGMGWIMLYDKFDNSNME